MEFNQLIKSLNETSDYFQKEVLHQVNVALTLRNWVIGFYLYEYEQNGQDRAAYGTRLHKVIAARLKNGNVQGMSERNLYSFRNFYMTYPQIFSTVLRRFEHQFWATPILQTLSAKLKQTNNVLPIVQLESAQLENKNPTPLEPTDAELLV